MNRNFVNKLLWLLLALCLSGLLLLQSVFAAEETTWNVSQQDEVSDVQASFDAETKTLTLSGTGATAAFSTVPWADYLSQIERVVVEEGVTALSPYLFAYHDAMQTVSLPTSLTEIGAGAFGFCTALTEVDLPDTVTVMEDTVFYNDTALQRVKLPKALTTLPYATFYSCSALTEVTLPEALQRIETYALFQCSALVQLQLPDGLLAIEGFAMQECRQLQALTLPATLQELGSYAFSKTGLTELTLPDALTEIPEGLLQGASSLTRITLPRQLQKIHRNAFADTALASLSLPYGVRSIQDSAFARCPLTEVSLPSSVTYLHGCAFCGCTALERVTVLGDTVLINDSDCPKKAPVFAETVTVCGFDRSPAFYYAMENGNPFYALLYHWDVSVAGGQVTAIFDRVQHSLAFQGTGAVRDIAGNEAPWLTDFSQEIQHIVLGEGITQLPAQTLIGCDSVRSVTVYDTATVVDLSALSETVVLYAHESAAAYAYGKAQALQCQSICAFSEAWHRDDTHHWHLCPCGAKKSYDVHEYGTWVVTKPATVTETGVQVQTCLCGHSVSSEIPKLDPPKEPVTTTTQPPQQTTPPPAVTTPAVTTTAPPAAEGGCNARLDAAATVWLPLMLTGAWLLLHQRRTVK